MGGRPIATVLVAGGGIVGWSAAAALKRHLRHLQVSIVPSPPPPDALADHLSSTLPSIVGFHSDLGLTEADTVVRTGSGYRLGTRFEGWSAAQPAYVHSYGTHGLPLGTTSFHHHWLRTAGDKLNAPFDSYSPGAVMAEANRFIHPQGEAGTPLASFEYGIQLNVPRYHQMMRAFARHLGVRELDDQIAEVRLCPADGFIDSVLLGDGTAAHADLFIDCTGPEATLRASLDSQFESWKQWLPCDRIALAKSPPAPEPAVLDKVVATGAGWLFQSSSPAAKTHGLVYSADHLPHAEAEQQLGALADAIPSPVAIRQGRRLQPWLRNCVAIGDSAVAVEPLEWTNLHLAHSAIDRVVAMMPDSECAPIELAEYNRQSQAEADRVRDFLILHYWSAGGRKEPFWQDVAAATPPPSLQHTLTLFRERGRLPFYEEETFSKDSWLAVMLGQGLYPEEVDPLTDLVPAAAAEAAMARQRTALASLAASLPTHSSYLRNLAARAHR